ncbi:FMN-binding protein [Frankia sp. R82]|uniref:FMN-binding protein n=1 Tax=Frankia sp. R82 TaxID=2950553 RepID=UPI002042F665|nr:FMN-binding protein [Frankia sp. R82]MCM3887254.1 FMN-binding protein [Frankia sp. R82]
MNDNVGKPYRARLGFAALLATVVLAIGGKAASGAGERPTALGSAPAAVGATAVSTPSTPSTPTASPTTAPAATTPSVTASASPSSSDAGTSATRTVTGDAIDTRFGQVQVKVVLRGTKIVDVVTVQVPDRERRDVEINDQAVPILRQEVLTAQNAKVDSVSGASYTSYGYAWSVQSALDKAGV